MSRAVVSGWYGDPSRKHEHRYWDGDRWTTAVSDRGNVSDDELATERCGPPGSGDRIARWAIGVLLAGGAAALALTLVWAQWTKTSTKLEEEERVRGWSAVLRSLPTAVIAWSVPIIAMVLAVRACRQGSGTMGGVVIRLSGVVLFIVSVSIIGETIDSAASGSHPELKWMLFPVSISIAMGSTLLALRAAKHVPEQRSETETG
jgi:hypothetical protein